MSDKPFCVCGSREGDNDDCERCRFIETVAEQAQEIERLKAYESVNVALQRDVAKKEQRIEELGNLLYDAYGLIIKHHNVSYKQELGQLCKLCMGEDQLLDRIFYNIKDRINA